ncbi:MAG TPA: class II fumarate hydratase [Marinagarivorans sp.]
MTRIEKDSLGEIEVPEGVLFGAQTQRAVQNFPISGMVMPRAFIRALGLVKYAAAQANGELGTLPDAISEAIADAALEVAKGEFDSQFPVDVFQTGSGTSSNMNANEVIAHLASEALGTPVHPNDHVNRGQSSNDVIPTCIHLSASIELHEALLPALRSLATLIDTKREGFKQVVKTGRTHLMDAMPLTVAQEWGAWAEQIRLSIERLESTLPRLHTLAQGGTAVGTGINTHPEFGARVAAVLSAVTGLHLTPKSDYFEALSCQDTALELSGQLKTTAASLMKISNDLRWMNSGPLAGLGELTLPALQPGSSIMPGKVNPVIPEAVAMAAAQVMGNDTTITIAAQSGNFQLNVMLPVIAHNLLQSIYLLTTSAQQLTNKVFTDITLNEPALAQALARNPVLVTALNDLIGYEKSAEIAKRAYKDGRAIYDVAVEMTDISPHDLRERLDPKNLT